MTEIRLELTLLSRPWYGEGDLGADFSSIVTKYYSNPTLGVETLSLKLV
jgi:hypothetical protein